MLNEYDVIVVGAGPAGSSAAKAASERGARTTVLEEHQAIGYPRHCSGRLHVPVFTQDIIESINKRIIVTELRSRRFFSPSGKMILETPIPPGRAYMVLRDEFDRELARQAADSGAHIVLNTHVTSLLKEEEKILGVATSSKSIPTVNGKIVIVAQGSRARRTGIPRQESLSHPDETFTPGILVEFEGIHDLETGVLETHLGALSERGYYNMWTLDRGSAFVVFRPADMLLKVKQGDYLISKKLRDAMPIQMYGYVVGSRNGQVLPRVVKDGLMLVGDSAGYQTIINAIISGRYAGEVAAAAIRDGDMSERRLSKYEDMCRETGLHRAGSGPESLKKLYGLSDKAIEAILPEMIQKNELRYYDMFSV